MKINISSSSPRFAIRLGTVDECSGRGHYFLTGEYYTLAYANAVAYREYQIYDSIDIVAISDDGQRCLDAIRVSNHHLDDVYPF